MTQDAASPSIAALRLAIEELPRATFELVELSAVLEAVDRWAAVQPPAAELNVGRLAKAYHRSNCPIRRETAYHSCRYQAKHLRTAAIIAARYNER